MWFTQGNPRAGLYSTGLPRQAILRLGKPEESYCMLLEPVLWHDCDRFHGSVCEVSMACSKHGLRAIWLKS